MKYSLTNFLVCPYCKESFKCEEQVAGDNEILEGRLICNKCHREYPIKKGIPRIILGNISKLSRKTGDAFGYEWQKFFELYKDYEEQFLDWIHPIKPEFFRDKIVLDAGCGMGRHLYYTATFGVRTIIGVDLSESVDIAYLHTKDMPNVHIIQCDMYNLPLKQDFDFIYSIGVLHHLPDSEEGFKNLLKYLKPGGAIFVWVYGRESNWLLPIIIYLRKITTRLPLNFVYVLSLFITLFMYPILKLVYLPLKRLTFTKPLMAYMPQNSFFYYLSGFSFRHILSIIFDQFIVPIANYYTKEEFERWFTNANLKNIDISWRNQNSWRGFGRK